MAPSGNLSSSELVSCFNLKLVSDRDISHVDNQYFEQSFSFDSGVYRIDPDVNTELLGYFQSDKYFEEITAEIKEEFSFKKELRESAQPLLPADQMVSIHVRRTDYCQKGDYHTNLTRVYYQKALQLFPNHRPVVFSDDIDWCKKEMTWLTNDPLFMVNDTCTDLYLMSLCQSHIIANSSFSWWAAWLGGGDTVAPKKWFGRNGPQDFKDVYCDGWLLL